MRLAKALVVLAVLLPVSGCAWLAPKTAALKEVHEIYREDFAAFSAVPDPALKATPKPAEDNAFFSRSLRAIREYRGEYGSDSVQAKHLDVLEGMIYLQAGRLGMARAVEGRVKSAAKALDTGSGAEGRDALFARCFPYLLAGREIMNPTGTALKFDAAASGIKSVLDGRDKSYDPVVDEGAVYLATTAAIYWVWAASLEPTVEARKPHFRKGRDLLAPFLTESELKAAEGATATGSHPGRMRYVAWFHFLNGQSQ